MRSLVLVLAALAGLAAAGAAVVWRSETLRLAARIDHLEQRGRALEQELARAMQQRDATTALLAERVGQVDAERDAAAVARRARAAPPPEGVRLALRALNECLRTDGFERMRVLSARRRVPGALREVELVERDDDGLGTRLYLADRLQLVLDRGTGRLTLTLHEGQQVRGEQRTPLPAEGLPLLLTPVDGRLWEARLADLLLAEGSYPPPEPVTPDADRLDLDQRAAWLGRLEALLAEVEAGVSYRVEDLAGLVDGSFTEVMLLGYDGGKRLCLAVEAERMAVRIDPERAAVELDLRSGILRRAGGETTISSDGYRIPLLGVTPETASRIMLGMVVTP